MMPLDISILIDVLLPQFPRAGLFAQGPVRVLRSFPRGERGDVSNKLSLLFFVLAFAPVPAHAHPHLRRHEFRVYEILLERSCAHLAARLKLIGIDGRAPPGVEHAA